MFLTKKAIPRRSFLRGAGVTLALPLLESMVPAATALAQTTAGSAKPRFVGVFYPHGMAPGTGSPKEKDRFLRSFLSLWNPWRNSGIRPL